MAYQIRICGVTGLFLRGGPGIRGRLSALVELPDPWADPCSRSERIRGCREAVSPDGGARRRDLNRPTRTPPP